MIITQIFLLKVLITVAIIFVLSLITEHISPRVSGIISGVPTGTAIILFFYGLENGTSFAVKSVVYNLPGMLSMYSFIYLYLRFSNKDKLSNILFSSLIAFLGYSVCSMILSHFNFNIISSIILSITTILIFSFLLSKVEDAKIKQKVKLNAGVLIFRLLLACSLIILVTSMAYILGPKWAGLFSSFPITLFPLILIIHLTYGHKAVHSLIKNVPKGSWAVIMYVISVYFLFPMVGVFYGTLVAYVPVIIYLFFLFKFSLHPQIK